MARYLIPNYKVEELNKKIQRIRNKGANVIFDIINPHVGVDAQVDGRDVQIDCSEIEIEGRYIINGWTFVGVIEHGSPENIIRLADNRFEGRIPERYRTAGRECEHCHIRRDRNDTYLVYNEDEDEFKQVGRTCLQSYTNGLNAETCAELSSIIAEVNRLNNGDFGDLSSVRNLHSYLFISMDEAKKKAYKFVQQHGYQSGETGRAFSIAFTRGDLRDSASDAEVNEVEEYLEANVDESPYIRNALAAWRKDNFEFRDGGLITSAVFSYFRYKQREEQRLAREHQREAELANINQSQAGNVGDKVTFTIADYKVAYTRHVDGYYGGSYPVYRIVGTDGRIYIWGCTTGLDLRRGMTLRGTVKRISEFRGETQTEVSRCKVVEAGYRGFSFGN